MVKRKKLNIKKLSIFLGVVLLIIILIILGIKSIINEKQLKRSIEYKLSEVGYSTNEIDIIKNSLNNEEISSLLNIKYNTNTIKFIKDKYFIFNNLDKYIEYSKNNDDDSSLVVAKVNTKASTGWYSTIYETDTSKNELMLVNKFYKLDETYIPDLTSVSLTYAYEGKKVSKLIYDNLINLLENARENGYKLVVSQGYRSYSDQSEAYNDILNSSGESYADKIASRPGHSDYQTGLSVDIKPYNTLVDDPSTNPDHEWLVNNAYKYGFILRYPMDKEEITGFSYDAWRFRYVGLEAAKIIYEDNITFDEYYEYYINGGKQ